MQSLRPSPRASRGQRLSLALLLHALPLPSTAAAWNASKWELVMLTDAAKTGAVCLDGSPGGYQIRPGAPGNKRWVIAHNHPRTGIFEVGPNCPACVFRSSSIRAAGAFCLLKLISFN